ncbi:hypothetical protein LF817_09385 [Halobacillus sp. A1]|uniref:hypothetical protein n=1 Tax=Halobacillus sp. A1 TaxID=2880262 RepID=UPI0020A678AD|nr:hypothetical protein [Halobacillus sp. A1]MCP3031561.1 hypothetical protein [Halobacillus sp. A1]
MSDNKNNYSKTNEQPDKNEDGFVKGVSKEAKNVVDHTVDTSGKIIKSVTGEGGLVGKTVDSSGNIIKKASEKGSDVIGKTVDNSSKAFKSIKDKAFNRKK